MQVVQSILAFISANKALILFLSLLLSEALSLIPGIKANGIAQLLFGWIKKEQAANPLPEQPQA